jgi:hypothetical protein
MTNSVAVSTVTTVKEHEKLIAFVLLLLCIVGLVVLASTFDRGSSNDIVVQGKLRIIDSSVAGLLAIAGMAAQALFRISSSDNNMSSAIKTLSEKAPPATGEAKESADETAAGALPDVFSKKGA